MKYGREVVVEAVVEDADDVRVAQRREEAELAREEHAIVALVVVRRGAVAVARRRFNVTMRSVRRSSARYTTPVAPRPSSLMSA